MLKELENLIEVASIKELCQNAGVIKVSERENALTNSINIVFYFDKNKYNPEIVDILMKKYGYNVKFSVGMEPYVTLKLNKAKDDELIEKIKEFLRDCKKRWKTWTKGTLLNVQELKQKGHS